MKLIDKYGRVITRLRISIIAKCNMNCPYCHREGYENGWGNNILSIEQIKKILPVIEKYEINSIKITGGEPLLHPHIVEIVKMLNSVKNLKDISMTTNGLLLSKYATDLKNAGLRRVNIGCDSLYNSSVKSVEKIEEALKVAKEVGFNPVKLNMVILRNINEHEIDDMIKFAGKHGFILQLIELIDTNKEFYTQYHVDLSSIEEQLKNRAKKIFVRDVQDRRQYLLNENTLVEVVHPMHNPDFCANCHTLRITNDFQFQPCLMRTDNLVPIEDDVEKALNKAMSNRRPYYVRKQNKDG